MRYFQRTFQAPDYPGITQKDTEGCIFSSIAGAFNYLHGKDVLSENELIKDWQAEDNQKGQQDLTNVLEVARRSSLIELHDRHRSDLDKNRPEDRQTFVNDIRECLERLGVAIVSLARIQHLITTNGPVSTPTGGHHMLTVVAESDASFVVWNTHGMFGLLSVSELVTEFRDLRNPAYDTSLAAKDSMEYLLLWH